MLIVEDFVKSYMISHLGLQDEEESFELTGDMYVNYGADQLDMLEITLAIEDEYMIEMPDLDYATAKDFIDAAVEAGAVAAVNPYG